MSPNRSDRGSSCVDPQVAVDFDDIANPAVDAVMNQARGRGAEFCGTAKFKVALIEFFGAFRD